MAGVLDVFNGNAYGVVSMTTAINRLPYVPSYLGSLGLFKRQGITTLTVMIERKAGKIGLIPAKARGGGGTTKMSAQKRDARPFTVQHLPYSDDLLADDIQGVRAFGTENVTETIQDKLNDKLTRLRQDHEITHEYHRIGALQGQVLDADGSTVLLNLFTEFNVSEVSVAMHLDSDTTDVKKILTGVSRTIQLALGAVPFTGIMAVCGDNFWDALVNHPVIKASFSYYDVANFLRTDPRGPGNNIPTFTWGGVTFANYRGLVGDVSFINTDQCRFFPTGVPDMFLTFDAPADYMETVNTVGQPVYAKQERMKFDRGIEIETQSNPLMICSRPELLIKGLKYT